MKNLIYKTTLVLSFLIISFYGVNAAVYHSTAAGGNWHETTTWEEGAVPTATDDVIITGPGNVIVYDNSHECNNITVESGAILQNRLSASRTLLVHGNVTNNGTITNSHTSWHFTITMEGNIENNGNWEAYTTELVGTGTHTLSSGASNTFSGYEFIADAATGNLTALTDLTFYDCRVNLNNKSLELSATKGAGFYLISDTKTAYLQNAIVTGNNNILYLENDAYLQTVELNDCTLEGNVLIRGDYCVFNGDIFVEDTLSNSTNVTSKLIVNGTLTNNGIITHSNFNFTIYCFSDVVNNGTWDNNYLYFAGSTTQNISCLNDHYFSCPLVEDTSSTSISPLNALTKVSFIGAQVDLNWGEFICNNNEIYVSGGARVRETVFSDITAGGEFIASNNVEMNGETVIKDTLTNPSGTYTTLKFDGNLANNGVIVIGGFGLYLDITGNIVNNGEWTTSRTNFTGTTTQYVTLGAGKEFACGEFNDMDDSFPVEAITDLYFSNTILDMNGSEIIFPVTKGLTLSLADGRIRDGRYSMNNGTLFMEEGADIGTDAVITDVTITGNMILYGSNILFEGEIVNQDTLQTANSITMTFDIDGNFTNNGVFQNPASSFNTNVYITGNITNNGDWIDINTHLSGTSTHEIYQAPGKEFYGEYFYADAGTGITTATTSINFRNCMVDFNDGYLVIQGDLSVSEKYLDHVVLTGNTNQLFMDDNARLVNSTVEDVVIAGKVQLGSTNTFTGDIVVQDTLINYTNTTASLTIEGNITNNGRILNGPSFNLTINSHGNIINNGEWSNHALYMAGTADQYVSCINGNEFSVNQFNDTDIASEIIVDGDVSFFGSVIDLNGAELAMQTGGKFRLTSEDGNTSGIFYGTITGGDFEYEGNDYAYLTNFTIEPDVTLTGNIRVGSSVNFTGSIDVRDTLRSRINTSATLNVGGRIVNNGHIDNGNWNFYIDCQGHIINNGTWENYQTDLNGVDDQLIYLIAGKEIEGTFRFDAMIDDPPYQWKWNGTDLNSPDFTGENTDMLIWNVPVSNDYYGYFGCQGAVDTSRNILIRSGIIIDPAVQLQGPYNGVDMDTGLSAQGLIPLTQPFNIAPWNYNGDETVTSIPSDIVDWILVELRETTGGPETATADSIVMRRALMLRNDGRAVDPWHQTPELKYDIELNDNIYLIIWHRNHLGVMSAVPISDGDSPAFYDFSKSVDKAYGGADAQADLGNGVYGMMGGDADYSQTITEQDKLGFWTPNAGTQVDYQTYDFNLDGQINNQGKNQAWSKNLGAQTQVPE